MPWNSKADVAKHNKIAAANPTKERAWREIANKSLSKYGDAAAIRIASAAVKHVKKEGGPVKKMKKGGVAKGSGAAVSGNKPAKIYADGGAVNDGSDREQVSTGPFMAAGGGKVRGMGQSRSVNPTRYC